MTGTNRAAQECTPVAWPCRTCLSEPSSMLCTAVIMLSIMRGFIMPAMSAAGSGHNTKAPCEAQQWDTRKGRLVGVTLAATACLITRSQAQLGASTGHASYEPSDSPRTLLCLCRGFSHAGYVHQLHCCSQDAAWQCLQELSVAVLVTQMQTDGHTTITPTHLLLTCLRLPLPPPGSLQPCPQGACSSSSP